MWSLMEHVVLSRQAVFMHACKQDVITSRSVPTYSTCNFVSIRPGWASPVTFGVVIWANEEILHWSLSLLLRTHCFLTVTTRPLGHSSPQATVASPSPRSRRPLTDQRLSGWAHYNCWHEQFRVLRMEQAWRNFAKLSCWDWMSVWLPLCRLCCESHIHSTSHTEKWNSYKGKGVQLNSNKTANKI